MAAAKLTVIDDEVLNESLLRQFVTKAKAGITTIKSALGKVLGLFEANDRFVIIDRNAPKPRIPFIKLHEAGHGTMPHQSKLYRIMNDCEKTLESDIADLFEREANVFASEVLFQGERFSEEAHSQNFGIKVPMMLAKKYGGSNYATFRRYVMTNPHVCCVVVLEQPVYAQDGDFTADVRRVVMSKSFERIYDGKVLCSTVTNGHPLGPSIPLNGKRMSPNKEIVLMDRNRDKRICIAEAFNTTYQILVLIRDTGPGTRPGIMIPAVSF
ncbi:ImmA/IrrE family metallo-endopeptidase [Acidiferrobacter thiooxydans]|nr:ImmA/IrrE family metallo-endopeptidase [Acidiferrobacter thiooxydans]